MTIPGRILAPTLANQSKSWFLLTLWFRTNPNSYGRVPCRALFHFTWLHLFIWLHLVGSDLIDLDWLIDYLINSKVDVDRLIACMMYQPRGQRGWLSESRLFADRLIDLIDWFDWQIVGVRSQWSHWSQRNEVGESRWGANWLIWFDWMVAGVRSQYRSQKGWLANQDEPLRTELSADGRKSGGGCSVEHARSLCLSLSP